MAIDIIEAMPRAPLTSSGQGRTAMRNFWVMAKSATDAESQLVVHRSVRRGAVYVDTSGNAPDPGLLCEEIRTFQLTPVPEDGSGLWFVDCFYAYPAVRWFRFPRTLANGVILWLETNEVSEPAEIDAYGLRVVNAADEFPHPLPAYTKLNRTLMVQWLQAAPDLITLQIAKRQYEGKCNSDVYYGAEQYCLRCRPLQYEELPTPSGNPSAAKLFRVTAPLEYREPIVIDNPDGGDPLVEAGGWETVYPNVGTRIKVNGPKKYQSLTEPNEEGTMVPVRQPVPLNAAGTARLADGAQLNYIRRRMYRQIAFAGLTPNP